MFNQKDNPTQLSDTVKMVFFELQTQVMILPSFLSHDRCHRTSARNSSQFLTAAPSTGIPLPKLVLVFFLKKSHPPISSTFWTCLMVHVSVAAACPSGKDLLTTLYQGAPTGVGIQCGLSSCWQCSCFHTGA